MDVSIVIPSWNGRHLLQQNLPALLGALEQHGEGEIIVVDDASSDDTVSLAGRFAPLRVVQRSTNGGFPVAANDGIVAARAPVVLLLNNDIEVQADTVTLLVRVLLSRWDAFAIVPRIVRRGTGEDEARTVMTFRRGVIDAGCHRDAGGEPAYACGGAMAFRRQEYLDLGGFDPLFAPFYWEDVDLSYRARKRGRRILQAAQASVIHEHGATIGTHFSHRRVLPVYERNRLIFTWKNLTDPALWRSHLAFLPLKCAWDLITYRAFIVGLAAALRRAGQIRRGRRGELCEATLRDRVLLAPPKPPGGGVGRLP